MIRGCKGAKSKSSNPILPFLLKKKCWKQQVHKAMLKASLQTWKNALLQSLSICSEWMTTYNKKLKCICFYQTSIPLNWQTYGKWSWEMGHSFSQQNYLHFSEKLTSVTLLSATKANMTRILDLRKKHSTKMIGVERLRKIFTCCTNYRVAVLK